MICNLKISWPLFLRLALLLLFEHLYAFALAFHLSWNTLSSDLFMVWLSTQFRSLLRWPWLREACLDNLIWNRYILPTTYFLSVFSFYYQCLSILRLCHIFVICQIYMTDLKMRLSFIIFSPMKANMGIRKNLFQVNDTHPECVWNRLFTIHTVS